MTGKEILLKAVRNETTPRPAWLPFVGVHGAHLTGCKAGEYLRSADRICAGLHRAIELYRPDGIPIVFDLQIEAEMLGCQLKWSDEVPPSVCTHPLEQGLSLVNLPAFDPEAGRWPVAIQALQTMKREVGDQIALYGLICGPFTLAMHLMGNDIFLHMFDNPEYVKAIIGYAAAVGKNAAASYLDNGADVIGVVDPMTSQISPEHFDEFVAPYANQVFDFVRQRGSLSSLFVCGDASRNLEAMARTNCDNMSIDENIPLERVRDITRGGAKSFGGNLKLTAVLLFGDEDDARLDAIRCIDAGGSCGFILAPGCDLPFNVPEANLRAAAEMVHDSYHREVARRTIVAKAVVTGNADLPDYKTSPSVCLDVITLDSASCAPCQYMMDAVHRAAKRLSKPVNVREHRIATRAGIAAMVKLGVKNIPTICIDGEVAFSSIIPDMNTLVARIEENIAKKKP